MPTTPRWYKIDLDRLRTRLAQETGVAPLDVEVHRFLNRAGFVLDGEWCGDGRAAAHLRPDEILDARVVTEESGVAFVGHAEPG